MLRLFMRGVVLLVVALLLVPAGFSKSPAKSKINESIKNTDDTTNSPSDSSAKADKTTSPEMTSSEDNSVEDDSGNGSVLPPQNAQNTGGNAKPSNSETKPAPQFTPMLATTGTLGLFTTETADTLSKGALSFSAYANKFGRMPGSVTIFQIGVDLSYGITDRFNIYATFVPYGHTHIGQGSELSLAPPNAANPLYPNTILPRLCATCTPGFVEDFPFAANDTGGIGDVTMGVKYGVLSERLGAPVSVSLRNDFILGTDVGVSRLLGNGTQSSRFSDLLSIAISKQWGHIITPTFNFGYEIVRSPRSSSNNSVLTMPDQIRTGAGFILLPEHRFQPMMEYTAVIFTSERGKYSTPDDSFGARDPVDGVWGLRMYPWKNLAIDAGFRYMLNLANLHDRYGFVVKIGTGYWPGKAAPPPPPNRAPTASCSADKSMVFVGSGDMVNVTATASDPDSDPLTYSWSATGGQVDGTGPQVRWLSAGTVAGNYTVTVKVDDGRGGTATCSADIRVDPRPNRPPTISCSADPTSVFAGERSTITCIGNDPDGDPLTYTWQANAGRIAGNGAVGDFDTTGLSPGTYTITTRVDDGRGGAADTTTSVQVKPMPPAPQATKISDCAFGKPLSTRIDNVCKRTLDDVALRLQNEPRASVVIIGYSDPKERRPDKIAGDRDANAVKYLGEKGIDASRVTTRTGSGQAGATNNRRIDIIYVPEGATY